ncbi:MAG: excisionase family DNA-binding protein [Candidatus Kerfeldbacteria bacterium]|nr:excisionase family DNA-binding protein [Candidatus Kerfeldbacteria bacterium]
MATKFVSTTEAAKLMGVSRITVFKKIQSGVIKATKIGRNYAIPMQEIERINVVFISQKEKADIEQAVKKTVREYGETLKLLGNA